MVEYKSLEPSTFQSLGLPAPTFSSTDASFFETSSFIYTLFFVAIIGAAFYEYILVGVYRMEASESGIRKSNETFKRTTLGLLGVFGLFLIIATLNRGLLTGDVTLSGLGISAGSGTRSGAVTTTGATTGSGGTSRACESTETTISKLTSSGGICGGVSCTSLSGCNYQQYLPIIDQEVGSNIQLRKMIIVTMCKESRANPTASNKNTSNGSYDCGLMQINQSSPCDSSLLTKPENIQLNIKAGVTLMRQKIALSSQTYQNIPAETGPFSSYNCCANGTVPNSPSADCTTAAGFPFSIPKWACPINPGEGDFNMCSVKSYACELSACMNQL